MQDEPRNTSLPTPAAWAPRMTLRAIARLSAMKSGRIGVVGVNAADPGGRQEYGVGLVGREPALGLGLAGEIDIVPIGGEDLQASPARRRTIAEPTIPLWPATNTRVPASSKIGRVRPAPVEFRHLHALFAWGTRTRDLAWTSMRKHGRRRRIPVGRQSGPNGVHVNLWRASARSPSASKQNA